MNIFKKHLILNRHFSNLIKYTIIYRFYNNVALTFLMNDERIKIIIITKKTCIIEEYNLHK